MRVDIKNEIVPQQLKRTFGRSKAERDGNRIGRINGNIPYVVQKISERAYAQRPDAG